MIGISTQQFDLDGDFVFYDSEIVTSDLTDNNVSRRITKVKTLDADVFIDDGGYSPGDTDITVSLIGPTLELYKKLMNVFRYHGFVIATTTNGNYLCVPQSLKMKKGNAVMVFSTKENA